MEKEEGKEEIKEEYRNASVNKNFHGWDKIKTEWKAANQERWREKGRKEGWKKGEEKPELRQISDKTNQQ